MSRARFFLTILGATICVLGYVAVPASAVPGWLVKGNLLAANRTANATFTQTGSHVFSWKDGVNSFRVVCKKATGAELLKGGLPGTSRVERYTFEECTFTGPAGCALQGVPSAVLPWMTLLENVRGTIYQVYNMDVEITLANCQTGLYNKAWPAKGSRRATVINRAVDVRAKFPEEVLEGETFETEGNSVEYSGEGELELEELGGTLQVVEEIC